MLDLDTFATTVYVMIDDFLKFHQPPPKPKPGPRPTFSLSEALTVTLLAQCPRFTSERDFARFARLRLRSYFPTLPHRTQVSRLVRRNQPCLDALYLHITQQLDCPDDVYQALDCTAVAVRHVTRRGRGWLAGIASKGKSSRLAWFFGFKVLASVRPSGVVDGFGIAPGHVKDQPFADTFFDARAGAHPGLPTAGRATCAPYLTDKGFEGKRWHARWSHLLSAQVLCPPKVQNTIQWPKQMSARVASLRQIVETVFARLHHFFGLDAERPHTLSGFQARLSAKMTLHNLMILLNRQLDRDDLEFADLIDW